MDSSPFDLRRLSGLAVDAFKELGNIGSAHASGALAAMLGRTVQITVPTLQLLPVTDLGRLCTDQKEIAAVHLRLAGEVKGLVSLCVPAETAEHFTRLLTGQSLPASDPMAVSVINELANIMGGAFLSAFYTMTGLNAFLTPPEYYGGRYDTAFSTVVREVQRWGDHAFVIRTGFLHGGDTLPCDLFFIPSPPGMVAILQRLGLTEIFA